MNHTKMILVTRCNHTEKENLIAPFVSHTNYHNPNKGSDRSHWFKQVMGADEAGEHGLHC